jgi:hypothetical protein
MEKDTNAMTVLQKLESGEIDADQALQMISETNEATSSDTSPPERQWWTWWIVPFSLGMAAAAVGYGLSQLGGAWWICAGPLLVLGGSIMLLALLTIESPWAHIRVQTGQASWPRRITISVPLPLRFTAQVLRWVSPRIEELDSTMIDELIIALEETVSKDQPIIIEVDENGSGERVRVFLG